MQSLLSLVFLGSVIAIIYSWRKAKSVKNENPDSFETDEDYQKFSNIKKKAIIACVASFVLSIFFGGGGSGEVSENDFAENVQTDGVSLGITPEEFMKKYNSTLNRLAKNNVDNLNIAQINGLNNQSKNKWITFVQKDGNVNTRFDGFVYEGKLYLVAYERNNSFDNNFMLISEAIMFSIPYTSRNMVKNFKSFFENKDYLAQTFYKGKSASDHYSENGITIGWQMMDDHQYYRMYGFTIYNEITQEKSRKNLLR